MCLELRRISAAFVLLVGCSSQALDQDGGDGPDGDDGEPSGANAEPRLPQAPAAYPSGPYGNEQGATIQNLSFLGWRDPAAAGYNPDRLEVVSLSDFYDPDGSKGVRLLALNASAVWCTVCQAEYRQLARDKVYEVFRPKGVEMLGVLFEDRSYAPARPSDLVVWGGPDGFRVPFPLVIDPGFKTGAYFWSDATPMNMLIDTRTMQILKIDMGYDVQRPDLYWGAIEQWLER